jgi:hypothetical protein
MRLYILLLFNEFTFSSGVIRNQASGQLDFRFFLSNASVQPFKIPQNGPNTIHINRILTLLELLRQSAPPWYTQSPPCLAPSTHQI